MEFDHVFSAKRHIVEIYGITSRVCNLSPNALRENPRSNFGRACETCFEFVIVQNDSGSFGEISKPIKENLEAIAQVRVKYESFFNLK